MQTISFKEHYLSIFVQQLLNYSPQHLTAQICPHQQLLSRT